MNRFINENINTPICGEYGVIVAGGGPAGIAAAIAAGRNGMKTLLIERYGFLGGMWTAGLINPIFDTRGKGGIVNELLDNLKARNSFGGFNNICSDFEELKLILDQMVLDAGVDILFHTYVSGAITENKKVSGIKVENKSGRQAYLGKIIIDCTGDGDVAASAGAEFKIGREKDGLTQPMTLMFVLGNIEFKQKNGKQLFNIMKAAIENNETGYSIGFDFPHIIQLPKGKYAVVQLTHVRGLSSIDAKDLAKAEIEGRRQVMKTYELFKKFIPEFKDVDLVYTAPQIGIRESRRILGEYVLTGDDAINGAQFYDGITTVTFDIDIHCPDSTGQDNARVKPYQIPFRCLIPFGIDGLLTAGRCISGDHVAHSSYRVTGNCMAMGEAAGIAASIAIKDGCRIREVDTEKLLGLLGLNHH